MNFQRQGTLTIAAIHSRARYALSLAVRNFSASHPGVELRLKQGTPQQVAELLLSGQAEIGVATEALAGYAGLRAIDSSVRAAPSSRRRARRKPDWEAVIGCLSCRHIDHPGRRLAAIQGSKSAIDMRPATKPLRQCRPAAGA